MTPPLSEQIKAIESAIASVTQGRSRPNGATDDPEAIREVECLNATLAILQTLKAQPAKCPLCGEPQEAHSKMVVCPHYPGRGNVEELRATSFETLVELIDYCSTEHPQPLTEAQSDEQPIIDED